jgi:uroporphyrinogen-III synthase
MHLLVTRPQPDAERTAQALQARGHTVTVVPVLRNEIVPDPEIAAGPFAAVVMTSANAARALERHARRAELTALPLVTVGERTAKAARAAGFRHVASADGGLPELARLIANTMAPGRLLYLAAQDRAGDLAAALTAHGFSVDTVVVYRMADNPTLAPDLRKALRQPVDGALHYSRRSAQMFLTGATTAGVIDAALRLTHYCVSGEVAAPLRAAGARAEVAAHPDEAALLKLLAPV